LASVIDNQAGPSGRVHILDYFGQTLGLRSQICCQFLLIQPVVTFEYFLGWVEDWNGRAVLFDPENHPVAIHPQDVSDVRRVLNGREDPWLWNCTKVRVVRLQEELSPGYRRRYRQLSE